MLQSILMNETPAPPSRGLVAGKYELVRLIGRGGMGSVWEARHISLGTACAIKFIEAEFSDSTEARNRFDKEAKAAATIQSKHAIQIYDHGVTEDGKPYIVMELLNGEPLDKRIERERLPLQETARIIQQVCRGLARAHERGIVHRDLKPENIFLVQTPDEDEPIAKVLDFGIAKMQNGPQNQGITSSTKTGAVLGTPFYMSPEQARGLRNVDHRADIWSLGVIAFKCVTGKLPFDGESVGDLLVKICTAPLPIPSQQSPGLPPSFDAWFARALDREPDRRFATATELADALGYVAGIPSRGLNRAGVPSGPYASSPGAPYATPAVVTPGPVLATPAPGAMTNAPFTSESIPGVPQSRGKMVAGIAIGAVLLGAVGTLGLLQFQRRSQTTPTPSALVTPVPETSTPPAPPPEAAPPLPAATPIASERAPEPPVAKTTPVTKPAGGKITKPPPPPPTSATTAAPPPPPPTTASAKKPNKHDPGY
jgi:eukaryotic-like serine/threonine-protein kinase